MPATYEPIASTTISGTSTSTVTFSSIPGTYTDLRLVFHGGYVSAGTDNLNMQFNSDTGSNYSLTFLYGTGSSAASARLSSFTYAIIGQASTSANFISTIVCDVMSYASSSVFKTALSSSAAADYRVGRFVNLWRSTSAITSITFFVGANNFSSGSQISLYGIKAA